MPTRAEVFGGARAMFKKASSMDEIVDKAQMLILDTIGARLWVSTEPALKPAEESSRSLVMTSRANRPSGQAS